MMDVRGPLFPIDISNIASDILLTPGACYRPPFHALTLLKNKTKKLTDLRAKNVSKVTRERSPCNDRITRKSDCNTQA